MHIYRQSCVIGVFILPHTNPTRSWWQLVFEALYDMAKSCPQPAIRCEGLGPHRIPPSQERSLIPCSPCSALVSVVCRGDLGLSSHVHISTPQRIRLPLIAHINGVFLPGTKYHRHPSSDSIEAALTRKVVGHAGLLVRCNVTEWIFCRWLLLQAGPSPGRVIHWSHRLKWLPAEMQVKDVNSRHPLHQTRLTRDRHL